MVGRAFLILACMSIFTPGYAVGEELTFDRLRAESLRIGPYTPIETHRTTQNLYAQCGTSANTCLYGRQKCCAPASRSYYYCSIIDGECQSGHLELQMDFGG